MCDAAYLCQVEALEREALAQIVLIPHLEEDARRTVRSVDQVLAEFDEWLVSEPEEVVLTPEDVETRALYELLGVGGGRRGVHPR